MTPPVIPPVYLIGAGPGDPGLITVRGLDILRSADVVIHDHRVSPRLLKQARPDAEIIDLGSAASQEKAQEAISYLLADKAREGKRVARIMYGDPFVFDRGGEEALFLREQHVPFEIVPGVPAGIGVPAYTGVPVTYPGGGDTVTLVRGYEDEQGEAPDVDWESLSHLEGTVVCYASAQQLPRIFEAMLASGWPADDDAVIVYAGTLPTQESVAGTIAQLVERLKAHQRREPAILVVGRVVGFREHLRWFDARPLFGKRVLVTRPRDQAAELVDRLERLGAEAIEAPMIRIAPPEDPGPLLRAAAQPGAFDWIVFTSVNAVESFMTALLDGARDIRALKGPQLCAVGSATAERLARYGIKVDLVPEEFKAEAVVDAMAERASLSGAQVLLPRSDIGREVIADRLRQLGAGVVEVVAYHTELQDSQRPDDPDVYGMLLNGKIAAVTFTSGSAVRNFVKIYGDEAAVDLLRKTVVAAIGPVTADAARELGITVDVQPPTYTVDALVEALAAHFIAGSVGS
jgi:uroporphyrinogen III methyltransferase / synthase